MGVVEKEKLMSDNSDCHTLFRQILFQAYKDATYNLINMDGSLKPITNSWHPPYEIRKEARVAQNWFYNADRDYRVICNYAGVNYRIVREIVIEKFEELNYVLPEQWKIYQANLL